jgi:hypothetical protein
VRVGLPETPQVRHHHVHRVGQQRHKRAGVRAQPDIVVAEGTVQAALKADGRIDALFCDVFHSRDDRISRLVTYQVDSLPGDHTRRAFDA